MTIDLKNQIVKYDTAETKVNELNLVQSTWWQFGSVHPIAEWLEKVGATHAEYAEEKPTVIVDPKIDASFFNKDDTTSSVKVIGEKTFWTSFFALLLPDVKPDRETYIRVYKANDPNSLDSINDEHCKDLIDVCDDVDDFIDRLDQGHYINKDGCYSTIDDLDQFATSEIDPFLSNGCESRTLWIYDNECGGIENAYPLHFANYNDLSCYMELRNSHGHLDQFPTHYIEPE